MIEIIFKFIKNFFDYLKLTKKIYIFFYYFFYPIRLIINFILKKTDTYFLFKTGRNLGDNACISGIISKLYKKNRKIIVFTRSTELLLNNFKVQNVFHINLLKYFLLKLFAGGNIVELNFDRYPYNSLHEFIKNKNEFKKKHLAFFISGNLSNKINYEDFKNEFYFSNDEINIFKKKYDFLGDKFAIVNPNTKSAYTTVKGWGVQNFQNVIDRINYNWVQVGSNVDGNGKINNEIALKNCINLKGKTNLRELLYLVYKSNFVLCNEGYLNHISSAFDKKCFIVMSGFTSTEHVKYKNSIFITKTPQIHCAPCHITGDCPKERKYCTEDIQVDKVVNSIIDKFDV